MIVTAWNPNIIPDSSKSFDENVKNGKAALPPCHAFFNSMFLKINFLAKCTREVLMFFRCSF
ncbi:MAG: hypothetical protein CM15mP102_09090 [Flavobacteriales bacterium]|nr:MAG: hypothetical protein CM15mP102_09090 [Flavobacteriales bacterium]